MQSGISASVELHTAFQDLVSSPSQRGLLATIAEESLIPLETIPSSSPSFLSDLSLLTPHLTPTAPLYILLRLHPERADGFIAITYVPDAAPVRQKTLFASTRLALVRELGLERFCESLFVTERAELEPDGWERHERSRGVEAPLTGEEQLLRGVKEAEANERGGMEGRRLEGGSKIKVEIESEVKEALKGLAAGGDSLVQLKIHIPDGSVHIASTSTIDVDQLSTSISTTEPRYSFFRYSPPSSSLAEVESNEQPVIFIYTCPSSSKIKERMVYASSKLTFLAAIVNELGIEVTKKLEVSSPTEITRATIEDEFSPRAEEKKAFDRPKRPGRR